MNEEGSQPSASPVTSAAGPTSRRNKKMSGANRELQEMHEALMALEEERTRIMERYQPPTEAERQDPAQHGSVADVSDWGESSGDQLLSPKNMGPPPDWAPASLRGSLSQAQEVSNKSSSTRRANMSGHQRSGRGMLRGSKRSAHASRGWRRAGANTGGDGGGSSSYNYPPDHRTKGGKHARPGVAPEMDGVNSSSGPSGVGAATGAMMPGKVLQLSLLISLALVGSVTVVAILCSEDLRRVLFNPGTSGHLHGSTEGVTVDEDGFLRSSTHPNRRGSVPPLQERSRQIDLDGEENRPRRYTSGNTLRSKDHRESPLERGQSKKTRNSSIISSRTPETTDDSGRRSTARQSSSPRAEGEKDSKLRLKQDSGHEAAKRRSRGSGRGDSRPGATPASDDLASLSGLSDSGGSSNREKSLELSATSDSGPDRESSPVMEQRGRFQVQKSRRRSAVEDAADSDSRSPGAAASSRGAATTTSSRTNKGYEEQPSSTGARGNKSVRRSQREPSRRSRDPSPEPRRPRGPEGSADESLSRSGGSSSFALFRRRSPEQKKPSGSSREDYRRGSFVENGHDITALERRLSVAHDPVHIIPGGGAGLDAGAGGHPSYEEQVLSASLQSLQGRMGSDWPGSSLASSLRHMFSGQSSRGQQQPQFPQQQQVPQPQTSWGGSFGWGFRGNAPQQPQAGPAIMATQPHLGTINAGIGGQAAAAPPGFIQPSGYQPLLPPGQHQGAASRRGSVVEQTECFGAGCATSMMNSQYHNGTTVGGISVPVPLAFPASAPPPRPSSQCDFQNQGSWCDPAAQAMHHGAQHGAWGAGGSSGPDGSGNHWRNYLPRPPEFQGQPAAAPQYPGELEHQGAWSSQPHASLMPPPPQPAHSPQVPLASGAGQYRIGPPKRKTLSSWWDDDWDDDSDVRAAPVAQPQPPGFGPGPTVDAHRTSEQPPSLPLVARPGHLTGSDDNNPYRIPNLMSPTGIDSDFHTPTHVSRLSTRRPSFTGAPLQPQLHPGLTLDEREIESLIPPGDHSSAGVVPLGPPAPLPPLVGTTPEGPRLDNAAVAPQALNGHSYGPGEENEDGIVEDTDDETGDATNENTDWHRMNEDDEGFNIATPASWVSDAEEDERAVNTSNSGDDLPPEMTTSPVPPSSRAPTEASETASARLSRALSREAQNGSARSENEDGISGGAEGESSPEDEDDTSSHRTVTPEEVVQDAEEVAQEQQLNIPSQNDPNSDAQQQLPEQTLRGVPDDVEGGGSGSSRDGFNRENSPADDDDNEEDVFLTSLRCSEGNPNGAGSAADSCPPVPPPREGAWGAGSRGSNGEGEEPAPAPPTNTQLLTIKQALQNALKNANARESNLHDSSGSGGRPASQTEARSNTNSGLDDGDRGSPEVESSYAFAAKTEEDEPSLTQQGVVDIDPDYSAQDFLPWQSQSESSTGQGTLSSNRGAAFLGKYLPEEGVRMEDVVDGSFAEVQRKLRQPQQGPATSLAEVEVVSFPKNDPLENTDAATEGSGTQRNSQVSDELASSAGEQQVDERVSDHSVGGGDDQHSKGGRRLRNNYRAREDEQSEPSLKAPPAPLHGIDEEGHSSEDDDFQTMAGSASSNSSADAPRRGSLDHPDGAATGGGPAPAGSFGAATPSSPVKAEQDASLFVDASSDAEARSAAGEFKLKPFGSVYDEEFDMVDEDPVVMDGGSASNSASAEAPASTSSENGTRAARAGRYNMSSTTSPPLSFFLRSQQEQDKASQNTKLRKRNPLIQVMGEEGPNRFDSDDEEQDLSYEDSSSASPSPGAEEVNAAGNPPHPIIFPHFQYHKSPGVVQDQNYADHSPLTGSPASSSSVDQTARGIRRASSNRAKIFVMQQDGGLASLDLE
ncbi:unnamed protein product [Amoebophrya sp. A120]|nr:unnamed protein product [Amoebophrya sp. A120]|eukprot:GSA120T00005536001.1